VRLMLLQQLLQLWFQRLHRVQNNNF
jgi:hypothetical protein